MFIKHVLIVSYGYGTNRPMYYLAWFLDILSCGQEAGHGIVSQRFLYENKAFLIAQCKDENA